MTRFLCHDCAYDLGYDAQWWTNTETGETCEQSQDETHAHRTLAVGVNTALPARPHSSDEMGVPRWSGNQLLEPGQVEELPSAVDLLDPSTIEV